MSISLYAGIAKQELSAARTTSEGKTYTLNHSDKLVVNMRYKGETGSNVNSQGWERSSSYFFKEIQNQHPEYFSKKTCLYCYCKWYYQGKRKNNALFFYKEYFQLLDLKIFIMFISLK